MIWYNYLKLKCLFWVDNNLVNLKRRYGLSQIYLQQEIILSYTKILFKKF